MQAENRPAARLAGIGLVAGFGSSFFGIGGGLIIVPLLTALLGYPLKRAIGTSLASIILIAAVGVGTETIVKAQNIGWPVAALLAAGALLGVWIGSRLLPRIPVRPLGWAFTILLFVAALRLVGLVPLGAGRGPFVTWHDGAGPPVLVLLGLAAGLSSALFGIGGGVIVVPGLTILYDDFAFHGARATSLAMIVPATAFGALLHRRLGTVDGRAVLRILPTAAAGAIAGVLAVNRLPETPLRWCFALFLLYCAGRLALAGERKAVTLPGGARAEDSA